MIIEAYSDKDVGIFLDTWNSKKGGTYWQNYGWTSDPSVVVTVKWALYIDSGFYDTGIVRTVDRCQWVSSAWLLDSSIHYPIFANFESAKSESVKGLWGILALTSGRGYDLQLLLTGCNHLDQRAARQSQYRRKTIWNNLRFHSQVAESVWNIYCSKKIF